MLRVHQEDLVCGSIGASLFCEAVDDSLQNNVTFNVLEMVAALTSSTAPYRATVTVIRPVVQHR